MKREDADGRSFFNPRRTLRTAFDSMDPNMTRAFLPWVLRHPRHVLNFIHLARAFGASTRVRKGRRSEGMMVPSSLILSMTPDCNLNCAGCYAAATGAVPGKKAGGKDGWGGKKAPLRKALGIEGWRRIIRESSDLGVYCFILAGGEPFLFPELLSLPEDFRDRYFLIYTNGTAMRDSDFGRLRKLSNVTVFVSVEGSRDMTDARRGEGVHDLAMRSLDRLRRNGTMSGITVTITRYNYKY